MMTDCTTSSIESTTEQYANMPQCCEKSIALLMCYLQCMISNKELGTDVDEPSTEEKTSNTGSSTDNQSIVQLVQPEINYLKANLKPSELHKFEKVTSFYFSGDYSTALCNLKELFREVCPFDVPKFLRLVELGTETAICTKDQEIILLLGGTGSGKSTTILYLSGTKLVEELNGTKHIGPDPTVPITNDTLRNVSTSNSTKSETKHVLGVVINLNNLNKYKVGTVVVCDTPGFGDTSGPEVDAAHSINIINVVRECKNVRPVILISQYGLGDRMQYLKSLINVIVGMIPNIEYHLPSFTYLFTKYTKDQGEEIHAKFEQYWNENERGSQSAFALLLTDILEKTSCRTLIVDPLDGNPYPLMNDIRMINPIQHPSEVFQFSLSEHVISSIRDQLTRNRFEIMNSACKAEYAIASYRLKEMQRLYEVLPQDFIKQAMDESVAFLVKSINERYKSAVTQFNEILAKGRLGQETIESYKRSIDHLKRTEILKEQLGQRVSDSASLNQNIISQGRKLFEQLSKQSIQAPELKTGLDNLALLSQEFSHIPDVVTAYSDLRKNVMDKMTVFRERAKSYLAQHLFDQYGMELGQLKGGLNTLAGHVDVLENSGMIDNLVQEFTLNIQETILQKIPTYVKHPKENTKHLIACDSILRSALASIQLQEHVDPKEVKRLYEDFVDKNLEAYTQLENEIIKLVKDEQDNWSDALKQSKELMENARIIADIPCLKSETTKRFYGLIELLCSKLSEARQIMEKELLKIQTLSDFSELNSDFQSTGSISVVDYNRLAQQLLLIKCADWLENYRPGVYKGTLTDIERQLLYHLNEMEFMLDGLSLDLTDSEKIRQVGRLLEQFQRMNWLSLLESLPNARESCDKMIGSFKEKVGNVLGMIQQLCKRRGESEDFNTRSNRFSCPLIKRYFEYIGCCVRSPIIRTDASLVKNELEQYVRDHINFIEQSATIAFNEIVNGSDQELFTSGAVLSRCLSEMTLFEKNPVICAVVDGQCMNNLLESFQQHYIKLSTEMDELMQLNEPHLVRQKIKRAKYLIVCDKYMTNISFDFLSQKYQEAASHLSTTIFKQMHEYIESHNYVQIQILMSQLKRAGDPQSEKHFEDAKRLLQYSLHDFANETRTMAINLHDAPSDTLRTVLITIVDNLKKMDRATQIEIYVDDKLCELKTQREQILKIITDKMERYMDKIDILIESSDFEEANNQEGEIRTIKTLLGSYCPNGLSSRIDTLESKIQTSFTKIIQTYSDMKTAEYPWRPPKEMLEKLYQMRKPTVAKAIEEALLKNVREEAIKVTQRSDNIVSLEQLANNIKKTLPTNLVNILASELEQACKEIANTHNLRRNEIQSAISKDNIEAIKSQLEDREKSSVFPLQDTLVNPLLEKIFGKNKLIQQLLGQLAPGLDDYSQLFQQVWNEMNLLFKYQFHLHEHLPEIKEIYEEARDLFVNLKEEWCKQSGSFMANPRAFSTVTVEHSFEMIALLVSKYDGTRPTKHIPFSHDLLGIKFMDEVKRICEAALLFIDENQERVRTALNKHDVSGVSKSLEHLKKWSFVERRVMSIRTSTTLRMSYSELLLEVFESIKKVRDDIINVDLPNEETRRSEKSRDAFFEGLCQKLHMVTNLRDIRTFLTENNYDISGFGDACVESLRKQARSLCDQTLRLLEKATLNRDDYITINHNYNAALSMHKHISTPFMIESGQSEITEKLSNRLEDTIQNIIRNMNNVDTVAENLIALQEMSDTILPLKSYIPGRIDDVLDTFKSREGAQALSKLAVFLDQDPKGVGQILIAEKACFKGYSVFLFNSKIVHQNIDVVLENIKGEGIKIEKDILRKRYEEFLQTYEDLVTQYLDKNNAKMPQLVANLKKDIGRIVGDKRPIQWNGTVKSFIPSLMAYIFAIWTLKNSQHFFDATTGSDDNYLLKPHAAQVLSIFRMLSIGDNEEETRGLIKRFVNQVGRVGGYFGVGRNTRNETTGIVNNLVEIGTGEGKSVTLAVTACILSLLGFDVMCACYSDFLSQRDYRDFSPIFDAVGVTPYIHYGTFNSLCEKVVNERGNVRELVENCVRNRVEHDKYFILSNRPKILLIDEVDVFFNKSFYGSGYVPSVSLTDTSVTALTDLIWNQRQQWQQSKGSALHEIKASQEFKNCCEVFRDWEFLIEEAVKDMLADISSFESHDYLVIDDRIGYKEQDGISFNLTFGYKTMFAYYLEHERGLISESSLKENIFINIHCGGQCKYITIVNDQSFHNKCHINTL